VTELTYREIGATRDPDLPKGYRHLRYRKALGRDVLAAAGEAVLTWRMHREAGVRIEATAPRAATGVEVTSRLGIGPLRLTAPCEVVWTVEDDNRIGFGYGTLPGHPARGEEAFVVERDETGEVWLTITAFSLPATWYMKAAGPLAPVLQALYARRCGQVLKRLAHQQG
jgi:uncharacterized protein (UPF0548 family)